MESYSAWAAGVWISKSKRRAVKPDDRAAGGETRYAAIDLFMPCRHALGKAVCISPPIHWMFERLDMKSRGRTDSIWFQCQKLQIMDDSLHHDNLATFSGISLAIHYIVFWHVITALAATVKQRMPRQWIQSYWAAWQKLHFWLCTPRRCLPFGWGLATALMMLLVNQAVLVTVECAAACGDVGAG